ncbi:hypothetical protein DENIS_2980 [Desulfonema ishimotonii]|uniref:Sec-independent protein translocase protein TatA n=1 Tax=Desulfonema ishimotonii TaxID=45657 RepID=A0A401FYI0_9BACT|nr:twin-arginine translocase TatA/TatE family subunit [Desulfonema ishimotonii]GBC62017.1 hypothetical protein DENIS_2980 [Desulfonema ishimotonii]
MFGMGMPEILLILAIALIVIGPKKLPELAKSLGRAMNEFKKATSELKETMEIDYDVKDVKKTFDDIETELKKPVDVTPVKQKETEDTPPETSETAAPPSPDTVLMKKKAAPKPVSDKVSESEEDMAGTDIPAELLAESEETREAGSEKAKKGHIRNDA